MKKTIEISDNNVLKKGISVLEKHAVEDYEMVVILTLHNMILEKLETAN